jgi:tetratricopeptide (TPR) repeat protein
MVKVESSSPQNASKPLLAGNITLSTRGVLTAALLVLVTLLVYSPSMRGEYLWDDRDSIPNNELLRTSAGLLKIWTEPAANPVTEQHYPMLYTSYWVEYQLWGANPLGYHLNNILLHALNSLLVLLLLQQLRIPGAWLAAWIFALHPVHVESTAWIVERKDLLSCCFYLLAAFAFLRFLDGRRWQSYTAALVLFSCGMLSKTMIISLPLALLLVVWWKRDRLTTGDWLPLVPLGILGGLLFLVSHDMLLHPKAVIDRATFVETFGLGYLERLLVAGRAIVFYARKLVAPVGLSALYPLWDVRLAVIWQWAFPALVGASLGSLWWWRAKIGKTPLVAVLFFCITLGPALGFVSFYLMAFTFVADRFQYLACLGPIALFSAALSGLRFKWPVRAGCVLLLIALSLLTFERAGKFQSMEVLIGDAIDKGTETAQAHFIIGSFYEKEERPDLVIEHYFKTIELDPGFYKAYNNLGYHLLTAGRLEEARQIFTDVVSRFPEDRLGRNNLAVTLSRLNQYERAIEVLQESVALFPKDERSRTNLGYFLLREGRLTEATDQFKAILHMNPNSQPAHDGLQQAQRLRTPLPG